jgi:hypothetical protein
MIPVVFLESVVHGVVKDGSTTYCGMPVPAPMHLRDLLIGDAHPCPNCFSYSAREMFDQGEPVDDDPPF